MQTKLTLRLEEELIEQAKVYAAHSGKSISQIVADYFKVITASQKDGPNRQPPPVTRSLRGLLKGAEVDESDYRKFLEEKLL